jgi:hypothetical protein
MHYKVLQCGWLVFVGPHLDWDGCLRAALGQQGALSHLACVPPLVGVKVLTYF